MFKKGKNTSNKSQPETTNEANNVNEALDQEGAREALEAEDDAPVAEATADEDQTTTSEAETAQKDLSPAPEVNELAVFKDRYARLLADFDNYRKRQVRDSEEFVKRANEKLLTDLLPIVDHLELALAKIPNAEDPFAVGVRLIYDQFLALLKRFDMTPIDAQGKPFDPAFHEALSQVPSTTVPEQEVLDQFRRGWLLAGRLLRPAQVIVSAGMPEAEATQVETESVSE